MDPKAEIESYVDDVVLRLPARLRKDVGLELRDLLMEELANKSEAAGRAPDEAMTRALLKDFGAPGDVAARYQPAANTIIPAREGRLFAAATVVSVLAQWALSFPLQVVVPDDGDFASRFGAWATGSGLHAFSFAGVVFASLIAWSFFRHAREKEDAITLNVLPKQDALPPLPEIDPDRFNRWAFGAEVVGFAIGIPLTAIAPSLIANLPDPAPQTLAFDPGFVSDRLPWLLVLWGVQLALFIYVLVQGSWQRPTRMTEMSLNLIGTGMLFWFATAPIFASAETDGFAKIVAAGVGLLMLLVIGIKFWREQARVRSAKPSL